MKQLFTVIALFVTLLSNAQKVQLEFTVGAATPLLPIKHSEGYTYQRSYTKVATGISAMLLIRENQSIGINISRYGVYYDAITPTDTIVDWVGTPMYNFAVEIRTKVAQIKDVSFHAAPRVGLLYDTGIQGINISAKGTICYNVSDNFGLLLNGQFGFNSFNKNISRHKRGRDVFNYLDYSISGGIYIKI